MTSHCLQEDNEREVMVRQSPVKIKEIYISRTKQPKNQSHLVEEYKPGGQNW